MKLFTQQNFYLNLVFQYLIYGCFFGGKKKSSISFLIQRFQMTHRLPLFLHICKSFSLPYKSLGGLFSNSLSTRLFLQKNNLARPSPRENIIPRLVSLSQRKRETGRGIMFPRFLELRLEKGAQESAKKQSILSYPSFFYR